MTDKNVFTYKAFEGSIEISLEDECMFGQILFIRDTVFYTADTVANLRIAFEEAVDQYLADCEEIGRTPNKPFSGTFNVRVGPERHRALASCALKKDLSINQRPLHDQRTKN